MRENLIRHVREYEREEIAGIQDEGWQYEQREVEKENYRLLLGDSCERMAEIETESVDLSVFSPPFLSLYTYSPTERDIGNCRNDDEFWQQFGIVIRELLRVSKPGRICAVHCMDIPTMKVNGDPIGIKDFPGDILRAFIAKGWILQGKVTIDKDPQAQAIRVRAKGLAFQQLHKDAAWMRPALADYILVFRKPGENKEPIITDLSNDDWIEWARPIWYGIRESETLNKAEGRDEKDEKHIAPLQLGTIERCVRLWSNKGELILSPFAGIGSEGYVSLLQGRRFVGIELKRSYFDAAVRNLGRAEERMTRRLL